MQLNTAGFPGDIRQLLESPGNVSIAVAFITQPGLAQIRPQLLQKLESGGAVRVLVDLQDAATDPSALWDLLTLVNLAPDRFQVRAYVPERGILHAKLFVNEGVSSTTVIIGSANISHAAFYENVEHGLCIRTTGSEEAVSEAISLFERLWISDYALEIDDNAVRLYETYCGWRRAATRRSIRRSSGAWRELADHLQNGPAGSFRWPSIDAAYVMGAITARGYLYPEAARISIPLLFKAGSYSQGRITVREVSFDAGEVLPAIPTAIAEGARRALPEAAVTVERMRVLVDLSNAQGTFDVIEGLFAPALNCKSFRFPRELLTATDEVVAEFIRGFAVASALLTDNTSMPGNQITGLPGQMTVWLRPPTGNRVLFDQLYETITRRLGITTYRHWRESRDPHLKLRCEDFSDIGFGIGWWDELVAAGVEYNQAFFQSQ